ncbi:type 2 lanthipeptide synthetase LanM family protein [Metabacillus sp. HB246100]
MLNNETVKPENFVHSLFLSERYQVLKQYSDNLTYSEDLQRVDKWKRDLYKESKNFKHRLEQDNYSEEVFEALITTIDEEKAYLYSQPLSNNVNLSLLEVGLELLKYKDLNEDEFQLVEFVYPFIIYASETLTESLNHRLKTVPYNLETVKQKLLLSLAEELLKIASRSIILELHVSKIREELVGDTPEERFKSFVTQKARNLESLFLFYKEYATLTRYLITRTDYFIVNIQELLLRLDRDWQKINSEFHIGNETLVEISSGLGDTHQRGKTVAKLIFENGKEIVYKPKPLEIATAYNQFVKWISERSTFISLPTYRIVDCGNYGWEEKVVPYSCYSEDEVKRYYFRFGSLAGLMYLLNGADMHFENVIAGGEFPYVIDFETIFHQYPKLDFPDSSEILLKYKQSESVIGTGLLPQSLFQNTDGQGLDFSALNGKEQALPFKVLGLDQINTDNMEYSLKEAKSQGSSNLPSLNGKPVKAEEYLDEIVKGFRTILQFFFDNKESILSEDGPLSPFKNIKIRIIARATQQYAHFLQESTHPDYMRDSIYLEKLFERMWYYPYLDKRIVKHEINDLLQRDIPYFTSFVDSCDLYDSKGVKIDHFFQKSGYEKVTEKIKNLSIQELEDQVNWLILSIEGNRPANIKITRKDVLNVSTNPFDYQEQFLEEAIKIGEHLLKRATFSSDYKNTSWLNVNIINNHWFVAPMKQSLYDGLSGVALFLLYLYKETNNIRYLDTAHAAIQSAINPFAASSKGLVSTFFGEISVLYALLHFQKLSPKEEYMNYINKVKKTLKQRIEDDKEFDLLSGSAGILHLLSNLYEYTSEPEYLDIIKAYGDHLIKNANHLRSGTAWKNRHTQTYLGGLSHGTSGIATALVRAGTVSGNQNYITLAKLAIEYDRSLYNADKRAWLDLRNDKPQFPHQWTHGSTGIGISRLMIKQYVQDQSLDSEVQIAMDNIENFGFKNNNNLSHGNMGDSELYLLGALHYEDDQLLWKARNIAKQALDDINSSSQYHVDSPANIESLGLFTGISGIGFQLLRLRNPKEIPSVLTLENAY